MINTIYSDPDFLMHHGIKGMKWGVRNDPENLKRAIRRVQKDRPIKRSIGVYGNYTTYSTREGRRTVFDKNGNVAYDGSLSSYKGSKDAISKGRLYKMRKAKIFSQINIATLN